MGHNTSLDGNRQGLRGFAAVIRPNDAPRNLLSLDARPDDRAAWCAVTITADPVGTLDPLEGAAHVVCVAEYNVDGGGRSFSFDVGRCTTVNLPAGFVRVRVELRSGTVTPWAVSAAVSMYSAGQRDARPRVVSAFDLDGGGTASVAVVPGCTDAELIAGNGAANVYGTVLATFEGRSIDATLQTQRGACFGLPCALPYSQPVALWKITAGADPIRATVIQYLGP